MIVGYGTAFSIGLVASVSSCLAMVGGLVLTLGASSAKAGGTWRTQVLFHIGRLGGFFVLGGVVGLIGSSFHLSTTMSAYIGGFVALVMLVLGVSLLDVFPQVKRLQVKLPKRIGEYVTNWGTRDHALAPLLLGVGTFFLPCGFTQSMQLVALASGNFTQGALTMLFFALGTFPMLALLSFGSQSIAQWPWRKTFFRVAGAGIIALSVFNIVNILSVLGITSPQNVEQGGGTQAIIVDGKQFVDITAKGGYSPKVVVAKAGVPTTLRVTTNGTFDCSASVVIPKLSYQKFLQPSEIESITLSREQATGVIEGLCSMGMYSFQIRFQ